ncbi:methyl-accepting chemotaxis protein, partial [Ruminococcaceae bacterium OttesenSCG-928-L11]|nr:methyl-accepting chemotaxis protein [Ruminococcaceae bacterium OttesenSCG-928-L11]
LIEKAKVLEIVADGDLTPQVKQASDQDTIGNAIALMLTNLNGMFSEINGISAQVASSSNEIANGAQSLAQGASEQAATVEEISAAVAQIATQSGASAEAAQVAAVDGSAIRDIAMEGDDKMQNMMNAVVEINEASKAIEKVIKAIDDIAFQTNILALNAAVEAARAGQHGKGFAVVADEVRNLAGKSAEAAKETASLISTNLEKAELGLSISNDTAQSLQKIVEGIQKTSDALRDMAEQSEQIQSATMQVTTAVDQVAQVVQQNSATSEESAAASEQMSSQAQALRGMVAHFRLRGVDQRDAFAAQPSAQAMPVSQPVASGFALQPGSKY